MPAGILCMNVAPEPLTIRRHMRKADSVRSTFGFRYRGAIGFGLFAPLGVAALFSTPAIAGNSIPGLLLTAAGWMAFLGYLGMRVWATLYVGGRKDHELQTEGPYSLCRNPLYLGSFAFAVAVACLLKSVFFGAVLLPAILLYLQFVVRAEEHFLELRFQEDYRNYCRRTPRFWPRVGGFRTAAFVRVDLKRLKKEVVRLSWAALLIIVLQGLVFLRDNPEWPRLFSFP
jgi:protein-S-isoprenylcysteine O-methyltransferase Ste14